MSNRPILTSLVGLEGSQSQRRKRDSKRLRSVRSKNDARSSSKPNGDCQSNATLENSTAGNIEESLFSPEDHHVSRPVEPGSKEAREMTIGSGNRLCACLMKQSRIASFSRTLLASSTWGSTEYFLRWEGSATKCNRSIFRLVPWTRPSSGTESGLSDSETADMDRRTQSAWDHAAATWPTLHGTAKEEYERRQGPTANELGNLVNRTAAAW